MLSGGHPSTFKPVQFHWMLVYPSTRGISPGIHPCPGIQPHQLTRRYSPLDGLTGPGAFQVVANPPIPIVLMKMAILHDRTTGGGRPASQLQIVALALHMFAKRFTGIAVGQRLPFCALQRPGVVAVFCASDLEWCFWLNGTGCAAAQDTQAGGKPEYVQPIHVHDRSSQLPVITQKSRLLSEATTSGSSR